MGMPFNKFTTLYERKYNADYFNQFRLTALLLHDPMDTAFKHAVRSQFEWLDQLTGKQLLFISFVDPPKPDNDHSHDIKVGLQHLAFEQGMDNDEVMTLAMHMLKLDVDTPLPCVVLTDTLDSDRFYVVPTSGEVLEKQFACLTHLLKQQPIDNASLLDRLNPVLLQLGSDGLIRQASRPIGDGLLALCAPMYCQDSNDLMRHCAQEVFHGEQQRLHDATEPNAHFIFGIYDELAQWAPLHRNIPPAAAMRYRRHTDFDNSLDDQYEGVSFKMISHQDDMMSLEEFIEERPTPTPDLRVRLPREFLNGCHPQTRARINKYNKKVRQKQGLADEIEISYRIDDLAFFIDGELNQSVTQMLRHCMGIEMPTYYCREINDTDGIYTYRYQDDGKVNLAKKNLPLGTIKVAYSNMLYDVNRPDNNNPIENNNPIFHPEHFRMMGEGFEDDLYKITGIRNLNAHVKLTMDECSNVDVLTPTLDDLKNLHEYLQHLIDNSHNCITELKQQLKPIPIAPDSIRFGA